ncbi:MBOAT family protein [Algibacter amylolyticus]|uniref:MBOAT family protein n=1 Tax=Algibacter amylolyticus TaxID=1608400 RepID=A0A5M7BDW1_9FLAO|nr:MBOAT family O-acyltransferase [Algibacter amylolyticus]KAA5825611.1 MBOAT family protein [Algibacter amylolyticus]MBB5268162.1 D-alanyl-lipoteichoic acid acyltransferase DltB (MBOAT superfamily) [Algibacter amylolyticus]TSJ79909.1 MBOAT family protein [Algibacter amylolyticus]
MIFNSLEFFLFLFVVYALYWLVFKKSLKGQNILLLISSYIFYGWWDWRFLFLIVLSTIVDYFIGITIYKTEKQKTRKAWLWVSVLFNLGLLGFFKYYNFFVDSWIDLFSVLGYSLNSTWTLNIILPVGISFYTFQTMSYSFDIYYKKLKPTKNFLAFAAFVSFFPQLVAGPIERASNLLHQIINKRTFNYNQCVGGLKLILWGLFKKMVIADSLGPIVDDIFTNYSSYSASTLVLGAVFFSFQIYGDFSGYSDIAIGTAKLFGIELKSNFKFPYFSRNIAEFWVRWHTSLSDWFRYYVYIPLGGSRKSKLISIRNIAIVFLISGLWHGANWTYLFWGAFHAIAFVPIFLLGKNSKYKNSIIGEHSLLPSINEVLRMVMVFSLVTFSWVFFRSATIADAFSYILRMFSEFTFHSYRHPTGFRMIDYYVLIALFVVYEYIIRRDERAPFKFKSKYIRFIAYAIVILCMLLFYDSKIDRSFIYFQF